MFLVKMFPVASHPATAFTQTPVYEDKQFPFQDMVDCGHLDDHINSVETCYVLNPLLFFCLTAESLAPVSLCETPQQLCVLEDVTIDIVVSRRIG